MAKDLKVKVRLEGDSRGAERAIKRTDKSLSKFASGIKNKLFALTAAFASVLGALKLVESAGERLGQRRALERSLESQGAAIDEFIGKLKSLSNNQIATSDIILASNRALALGISKDDIPGLLEAATKASVSLGISATQAFNDITTGVGRASPLILDNLGIVVDAVKIYSDFADSVGKTVEELTKQEKTAALTAAVIKTAGKGAEDFADAQSKVTVALAQSTAKLKDWFENTTNAVASSEKLAEVIEGTSSVLGNYGTALGVVLTKLGALVPAQDSWARSLATSRDFLRGLTAGVSEVLIAINEYGESVTNLKAIQEESDRVTKLLNDRRAEEVRLLDDSVRATSEFAKAQEDAAARTARIEAALKGEATALQKLGEALGIVTAAELEAEVRAIEEAMQAARDATLGFSQELIDAEAEGTRQVESLRLRADNMRRGLGDMGKAAADAALGFTDLNSAAETTGENIDELGDSIDDTTDGAGAMSAAMRTVAVAVEDSGTRALTAAQRFNELAEAAGRAAAVADAVARGGRTSSDGRRVHLPGGGSRLTREPGLRQSTVLQGGTGLSDFGSGGRFSLNPDGTLRPT